MGNSLKFKKGDTLRVLDIMGWEGSEVEVLDVDCDDDINPYCCQDINDKMVIHLPESNL